MSDDGSSATNSTGESQPSDTMRGRAEESSWKIWILMEANRWAVTGLLFAGIFVSMVVLGVLDPSPLQQSMVQSDPTETLFQAYVTAIITGVTLVVTLNQLVLSEELGHVGDQRNRMEDAMEFRADVADLLDVPVSPPDPASFLQGLVAETSSRAETLADTVDRSRDAVDRSHDEELTRRTHEYVESLTKNADEVTDRLDEAEFGSFDMLSAVLDFNYSWKIFQAHRLRGEYADSLSDEAEEAFTDVEEVLVLFAPAREHFKTLYFRWELVNLSRAILYAAVPALVVVSAAIVYYDAQVIPGATLGISNAVFVTSGVTAIATSPFLLLLAYVLRIATVAKRTLSIGPFILRSGGQREDIDYE